MNYTQEELNQRFEKLPEDLKMAMVAVDTADIIKSIGVDNHLHIDQMGQLGEEVGLFMLGVTKPHQLVDNISKKLHISIELAREIAKKLDEQIFKKVRDSLQAVQGFTIESPKNEPATPAITQTVNQETEPSATTPPKETEISPANPKPARDIFKEKMNALFTNTKEEIVQNETPKPTSEQKIPPRHDPYRELA